MKVVFTIIGVILVLLLFGTMMGGIDEAQTDERTDAFGAVATAPGVTVADVVLVVPLYVEDVANVVEITSDLGTDVPLPNTYTALTRTLNVTGLTANDTRTLTVTYLVDALTDSPAVGQFFNFMPLLIVIALVIIVVAGMIYAFKNK